MAEEEQQLETDPPAQEELEPGQISSQKIATYSGWVLFAVSGAQLNPEIVTQGLGIQPDRTRSPTGELEGIWQINSNLSADTLIEEHVWQLMQRLMPQRHALRNLSRNYRLEFYCAVEKKPDDVVHFALQPRLLLLIGHLGANLIFDLSDKFQADGDAVEQ